MTSAAPHEATTPESGEKPWKPKPVSSSAFSVIAISFYFCQLGIGFAVYHGNYWIAAPLILISAHFMHGLLVGFHEASHSMLKKNRTFNDIEGIVIGTLSYLPFTLYRVSHQSHHSHFTTEKDEELWPFNDPKSPRWARCTAAFFELNFGLFFTPFLFMRSFLRKDSPVRSPRIRKKIWKEIAGIALFWITTYTLVTIFGLWKYYFTIYLIPSFIGGNLQSWRKYIEHVGLTSDTARGGTRSIIADNFVGKLISYTLLHEPYHGLHHLHMSLPHAKLPPLAAELEPEIPEENRPFRSYFHALRHLLRELPDPKVGSQWKTQPTP